MVLSVVAYACQVFYNTLSAAQRQQLQCVAKRANVSVDVDEQVFQQQISYMHKVLGNTFK